MPGTFNRKDFLTLATLGLLERAAFYGLISNLFLYLIDPDVGLGLLDTEAGEKNALFNYAGLGALLLVGPLADFIIPKKRQFETGFSISIVGYLMLLLPGTTAFMIGVMIISFGSSIIHVCIYPRLGALFSPLSIKREAGFAGFNILLSFGAAISTVTIGTLSYTLSFKAAFVGCALLNAAALVICFLKMKTKNGNKEVVHENNPVYRSSKLAFFIIFLGLFYYAINNVAKSNIDYQVMMSSNYRQGLIPGLSGLSFPSMNSIMVAVLGVLFFILLYFRKMGDSMVKLLVAIVLLSLSCLCIYFLSPLTTDIPEIVRNLVLISLLMALADVIFEPIATSFITRISPLKYQHTFLGFYLVTGRLAIFTMLIFPNDYEVENIVPDIRLLPLAFVLILMSIPLLIMRKTYRSITTEAPQPPHLPE